MSTMATVSCRYDTVTFHHPRTCMAFCFSDTMSCSAPAIHDPIVLTNNANVVNNAVHEVFMQSLRWGRGSDIWKREEACT